MKDANFKNCSFYKGKKVLITGHTGFKGAWLVQVLNYLGAEAMGYALAPEKGCLYEKINGDGLIKSVVGDIRDYKTLELAMSQFQPEIVLHLAALALVKDCYDDPVKAYETNVLGTVNLLENIRHCKSVKSVVVVTTDKVYENKGDGAVYKEEDLLGGADPYASSKACMELVVRAYRDSYFLKGDREVGIGTVRASNVLGGGDHVRSRLIPSILNAVSEGKTLELRNPNQTRPWQSVLDALNGYLTVGRYLYENPKEYSEGWNIGPTIDGIRTVSWVFDKIKNTYNGLEMESGLKFGVHESETLGLNIQKSLVRLDWAPTLSCDRVVEQVTEFFKSQQSGVDEREICMKQIDEFFKKEEMV